MEFRKRGTLFAPAKPVLFEFQCTVEKPMCEISGKMYMFLLIDDNVHSKIHDVHVLSKNHLQQQLINPLQGNVLKIKVPYKYNKVTCKVSGNKAVQELVKGDSIHVSIEYCGVWVVNGYCGPSWKLFNLTYP
jgi:hypothetical protein